jgi:hypothetical protein
MMRVVNMTARRATKKARGSRASRVRATRVIMETSPREEGDDGHNNQLGTKATATARTVMATTARAIMTAARAMATGAKMATALAATMATTAMTEMMATMVTMTPNSDDDYKNQAATTARITTTVARAKVTGSKEATATMATMATTATTATTATMARMATMTPNSNDAASGDKGNKDTK